jgi:hypothetical protein
MEVKSKKTEVKKPNKTSTKANIAKQIQELSNKINSNITKKWFETTILAK